MSAMITGDVLVATEIVFAHLSIFRSGAAPFSYILRCPSSCCDGLSLFRFYSPYHM